MRFYYVEKTEKEKSALPAIGRNVLVQCEGFRGLAHLNKAGHWKTAFGNKLLPKYVSIIPLT